MNSKSMYTKPVIVLIDVAREGNLSLERGYTFVHDDRFGAVVTFSGTVRATDDPSGVTGITYEAHPNLTIPAIQGLCSEVMGHRDGKAYVAHAVGFVKAGEASVIVAVAMPHRKEAFEACAAIMNLVKVRAPIWKLEHYRDGKERWLDGNIIETAEPTGPSQ